MAKQDEDEVEVKEEKVEEQEEKKEKKEKKKVGKLKRMAKLKDRPAEADDLQAMRRKVSLIG